VEIKSICLWSRSRALTIGQILLRFDVGDFTKNCRTVPILNLIDLQRKLLHLTPWSWCLLEKPSVTELLNNFPAFFGTRMFIIVITRALLCSLSYQNNPVHTTPSYVTKIRLNIILPSTSVSSQWSLSFWLSRQNSVCLPLILISTLWSSS
jgi:hypothetical protein